MFNKEQGYGIGFKEGVADVKRRLKRKVKGMEYDSRLLSSDPEQEDEFISRKELLKYINKL